MSAATRKRLEPILFIDRDAWSRTLGEALSAAGIRFIAHHQRFDPACPDPDWLEVAGREGWVVLTRDKDIRRRPRELAAVKSASAVLFVMS